MNTARETPARRSDRKARVLQVFLVSVALVDALLVWAAKREPERATKPSAAAQQAEPQPASESATASAQVEETPVVSEEPAKPVEVPKPRLSAGVEDIVKLAQAQVDASVLQTFIDHSPVAYYLSPDEIVYLRSVGVSSELISGVIRHGAKLRGQAAEEWREKEKEARVAQAAAPVVPPSPAPAQVLNYACATPVCAPRPVVSTVTYMGYPSYTYAYPAASSVIYFPSSGLRYRVPFAGYGYRGYYRPHSVFYGTWAPRHWSVGVNFGYGAARLHGGWRHGGRCR
ncbi:MAG: hypothetical protein HYY24_19575 [Verrucomicrobia bacterium]|nr:hypothetical protein [Verrucomicrobiota bacterium]